jgi:hypothetical protein
MPRTHEHRRGQSRGLEWLVIVFLFAVELAVVRSPALRAADDAEVDEAGEALVGAP